MPTVVLLPGMYSMDQIVRKVENSDHTVRVHWQIIRRNREDAILALERTVTTLHGDHGSILSRC
jgi:hypothetical protein